MKKQNSHWPVRVRIHVLGLLLMSLVGCSTAHTERDTARLLGAYQTKLKTGMENFAASRDRLAEARYQNVEFLEYSAAITEGDNSTSLVAWRIAEDKQRLGLHDGIRNAVQEQITKAPSATVFLEEHREVSIDIRAAVKARADKLGESAKVLGQLAEPKDLRSQIEFYVDFSRDVSESVKKQQEEAEKKADEGKKKAAEVAETTKNTVGTMAQQKHDAAENAKKDKSP